MKGIFDAIKLESTMRSYERPMDAPTERRFDFLVGILTLDKARPSFSYGWGGKLSPESQFRKERFSYPAINAAGFALVLRAFVHASGEPEEFFAGWVPLEVEAELDRWIEFLNTQIALRLADVPYDAATHGTLAPTRTAPAPQVALEAAPRPARVPTPMSPERNAASLRITREKGLIPVGFFRELLSGEPDAPSIVEARGKRPPHHKAEVVAYLRAGEPTFMWMTTAGPDYFSPDLTFGGDSIHTDGVYGWPSTLEAYVERYDVELPAAFEEHMRRNEWRIPSWPPPLIREVE
jgi:hypothetical protein